MTHPALMGANLRELPGSRSSTSGQARSVACLHGTFVAGILCAPRGSAAPAICPRCTLLVRPIFLETASASGQMPSATPDALAAAMIETIEAGAGRTPRLLVQTTPGAARRQSPTASGGGAPSR